MDDNCAEQKQPVKLIDSIALPQGLRSLSPAQLATVASELREELIDSVATSGGHFASSLGATELTVALHAAFQTPNDRIVWDVGHQAYIHKMLTGRRADLGSIRKKGGISGFLKRNESPYDSFGAGHAGTSISAAVGMSVALQNDPSRYVVAVIGDGSLTAGMAFEALNHAGHVGLKNFIVVINDNEMSISPNVGALSWLFSKAVTSKTSTVVRSRFKNLYRQGYVPEIVYQALDRAEEATQGFFNGPAMLFESFGFRYIGPVDGHNLDDLMGAIENAKAQDVPVVLHTYTTKGKGYQPAEGDPITWHGVVPFNRVEGRFVAGAAPVKPPPSYTSVFAETLVRLAKKDPKIVAITAAMLSGTGLDTFQAALPNQCFDVGICEQHAVTFAAGLACEGYHPVCAIYSTFLQRAFDQVVHDVCIQNLPVTFAIDRGGVVGNDGETHQGVFDIAYLRTLPNMVVMSPKDEHELKQMLEFSVQHQGPIAVRYPRGNGVGKPADESLTPIEIGRGEVLCRGKDALLVCFGPVVQTGLRVAEALAGRGISATVINARFAKPLDRELLRAELPQHRRVYVIEDHVKQGGFASAILEFINEERLELANAITGFGVGDEFVAHASQAEQQATYGYDFAGVMARVLEDFATESSDVQGRGNSNRAATNVVSA